MSFESDISFFRNTMVNYFKHLFIVYGVDFLDDKSIAESNIFTFQGASEQVAMLQTISEAAIDDLIKEECKGITNPEVLAAYQS